MSTKIYNGYRIDTGDIFAFTGRLRAKLNPVRDRLDARLIAEKMTTSIDNRLFGITPKDDETTGDTTSSRADEAEVIAHHRRTPVATEARDATIALMLGQSKLRREGKTADFDYNPNRFELTIARDQPTGDLLAITYCEQDELAEAFRGLDEVSEYGYWNNTDQPDDVTDEEWEARRQAWDRSLGWDAPAERMLTFKLRSDPGADLDLGTSDPVHPLVLDELPSMERRARRLARQMATARLTSHLRTTDTKFEFSMIFRLDPARITETIEPILPELNSHFLARPLADLHRLITDDQHAAIAAAVSTWWKQASGRILR